MMLKNCIKVFLHLGQPQAFAAVAIVASTQLILNQDFDLQLLFVSYCLTSAIYIYDRTFDYNTDFSKDEKSLKKFQKFFYVIAALIALIAIVIAAWRTTSLAIFSIFALLSGAIYPVLVKPFTEKSVAFKNFYVSLLFASIVFLPVLSSDLANNNWTLISVFSGFVFLKSFSLQIVLDIKDSTADGKNNLKTIPVQYGKNGAINIFNSLWIFSMLYIVILLIFKIDILFLLALSLSTFVELLVINTAKKESSLPYLIAATAPIIWFSFLLIANIAKAI